MYYCIVNSVPLDLDKRHRVKIVGILNITPDSFFDGGKFCSIDNALAQAFKMITDGADIIDIGGESTRPGHTPISAQEEIARVTPIFNAIKKEFPNSFLSIDTYKATVAAAALELGASMVNDIWGLKFDSNMASVIAKANVPCVLGHNRNTPLPGHKSDFIDLLKADLRQSVDIALDAGIKKENIILDPNIGFGQKTYKQNLACIKYVALLKELGYPIYIGASNKSFIGAILSKEKDFRLHGTIAANIVAIANGASYIRVHDVVAHKDALAMLECLT